MKTYTVKVTQRDIDNGRPDNIFACPVKLAIARVTGKKLYVSSNAIFFLHHAPIRIPDHVAEFIKRFDAKKRVHPFTFKIELP